MNGGAISARSPASASATKLVDRRWPSATRRSTRPSRRRCATARPWASRSCRRCRGCRGRRGSTSTGGWSRRRRGERVLVPHRAGQQVVARVVGHLEDHAQVGQRRAAPRRASGRSATARRSAVAPASCEQVAQLLGDVAVVDVERGDARLERPEHRTRGTRCRCAGRSPGGPGPTRGPRAPAARCGSRGRGRRGGWPAAGSGRSTSAHVRRRSPEHQALGVGSRRGDRLVHRRRRRGSHRPPRRVPPS